MTRALLTNEISTNHRRCRLSEGRLFGQRSLCFVSCSIAVVSCQRPSAGLFQAYLHCGCMNLWMKWMFILYSWNRARCNISGFIQFWGFENFWLARDGFANLLGFGGLVLFFGNLDASGFAAEISIDYYYITLLYIILLLYYYYIYTKRYFSFWGVLSGI